MGEQKRYDVYGAVIDGTKFHAPGSVIALDPDDRATLSWLKLGLIAAQGAEPRTVNPKPAAAAKTGGRKRGRG